MRTRTLVEVAVLLTVCGACDRDAIRSAARLEVSRSSVDFGFAGVGEVVSDSVTLTNVGGVRLHVVLSAAEPFSVARDVSLAPGERTIVDLSVHSTDPGRFEDTLLVTSEANTVSVKLSVEVVQCPFNIDTCIHSLVDRATGACSTTLAQDGEACSARCVAIGTCSAGSCSGPRIACDDGVQCTQDRCDDSAGCLHAADDTACPASIDPCLAAICDADAGCAVIPVPDGTSCGTTSCSASEICNAGTCIVQKIQSDSCEPPIAFVQPYGGEICAYTASHTVKCWGSNPLLNYPNVRRLPTEIWTPPFDSIQATGVGYCVITPERKIDCWGQPDYVTTDKMPKEVDQLTGVKKLITGPSGYACALIDDGGVQCWGTDNNGQLGHFFISDPFEIFPPQQVQSLPPAQDLQGRGVATCALSDGGVYCWGSNDDGSMCDGTHSGEKWLAFKTPCVSGGAKRFNSKSCVAIEDGGTTCWGALFWNEDVKWGVPYEAPVSNAEVIVGEWRTCAVADGGVWCWGRTGDPYDHSVPHPFTWPPEPVEGLDQVVDLATTSDLYGPAFCALQKDHRILCWGSNQHAQLGNGTFEDSDTPVEVLW